MARTKRGVVSRAKHNKVLKTVKAKLEKASKAHAGQAKAIGKYLKGRKKYV